MKAARSNPRDAKLTNPKDFVGSTKLPVHLVPDTMVLFASLGFLEGALKYGRYNWRVAGVRLSIYWDALERHRMKFCAGEWADKDTKVPHLASMLACIAIILDAHVANKLNDDRPPSVDLSTLVDSMVVNVKHLKDLYRDHAPYQYTIADSALEAPVPVSVKERRGVPKAPGRNGGARKDRPASGRKDLRGVSRRNVR